jgi:hypothetical protein
MHAEVTEAVDGQTLASTTNTPAELQAALGITSDAPPADTPDTDTDELEAPAPDAPVDQAASDAGRTLAKRRGSFQSRINELTREREDERRRREALERELETLRRPLMTPPLPEPREQDYDNYAELEKAKFDYAADQNYRRNRLAEQQAAEAALAQASQDDAQRAFQDRIARAKSELPDFEAVVNVPLPVSAEMRDAIVGSDIGPRLAYYFAQNQQEAAKLAELRGADAYRAIGKLEARLEAAPTATAPAAAVTNTAPAPVRPVTGGATASRLPLDHPDVSFREYEQRRNAGER